jgi:predicted DNA-binding protein (MmcQ/YjbR family)
MPDVDWLRKLCLSLADATETLQWGETLCFKVRGKIFATVHLSEGKLAPIVFKCTPEKFADLLEIEGISEAPYVGRYQWVLLANPNVLAAGELEALILRSYDLVVAKAPRQTKAQRQAKPRSAKHGSAKPRASKPRAAKHGSTKSGSTKSK